MSTIIKATDAKKLGAYQDPSLSSVISEYIAKIRSSSAFNDKDTINTIKSALIAPPPQKIGVRRWCKHMSAIRAINSDRVPEHKNKVFRDL